MTPVSRYFPKNWVKATFLNILFMLSSIPAFGADNHIGVIKTYKPNVALLHQGVEKSAEVGALIYRGDTIITQSDAAVGVIFIDGAVLSLGPETKFVIDDFVFKPDEHHVSFLSSIMNGTAAFISGAIGRISPESVKIKTPTATLGLRGTKILVEVQ